MQRVDTSGTSAVQRVVALLAMLLCEQVASAQGAQPTTPPVAPAPEPPVPDSVEEPPPPAPAPPVPDAEPRAAPILTDEPPPPLLLSTALLPPAVEVHGFVSQGGFLSTDNDYLGDSSRGSLELFEGAINVSAEPAERLRAGLQLFTRDLGPSGNYDMKLDWAYLDYRWRDWLGLRAGRIKMPFGLFNEFADIDSARLPILLPQGVYQINSREALLAHTGVSLYGNKALGPAGAIDYQALAGTIYLEFPASAEIDVGNKYIVGGQLFWRPPFEGARVGGSYLRTNFQFARQLDPALVSALIAAELVPADFDGHIEFSFDPMTLWVASAEYLYGDWMFAAEYSQWLVHISSNQPVIIPESDNDSERFYALVSRRVSERFEVGGYYSVKYVDLHDRDGSNEMRFPASHRAFQKDAAATLRFDVNDSWLWKLEAHFMDGTADLEPESIPDAERYWGMFLAKTTVSF